MYCILSAINYFPLSLLKVGLGLSGSGNGAGGVCSIMKVAGGSGGSFFKLCQTARAISKKIKTITDTHIHSLLFLYIYFNCLIIGNTTSF